MNTYIDHLLDFLFAAAVTPGKDGPVNMTHYLYSYTSDVMASYLLDVDMGYLEEPDPAKVHDTLRAFGTVDLAAVLKSIPPVKLMFNQFPILRRLSQLGRLDKVY
jgi:hypothetical protein